MKYWIHVLDQTVEVELDGAGRAVVDGRPVRVTVESGCAGIFGVSMDEDRFLLGAQRHGGKWTVTCGGETVPVTVETERSRRLAAARGAGSKGRGSGAVRAPMPGLVLRVDVSPGAAVEEGAGLLVLEAMKMENQIRAPVSGVVKRIGVAEGQAVEKGVLLVEIASEAS